MRSLLYLHPSKALFKVDNDIFAVEKKQNNVAKINLKSLFEPRKNFFLKKEEDGFSQTLVEYVFSDRGNSQKLVRSLNSVSLASVAPEPQTNLISIWAAFEALLPEPIKDGDPSTRISHFEPLILPCAVYDYASDNFAECYRNCNKELGTKFRDFVSDIGTGNCNEEKFASIFVGRQEDKLELLKLSGSSPLLMNRFSRLEKALEDPKNMINLINIHEKRVSWQIYRIYRERNLLVHNSTPSPFLQGLTENAYAYYRKVFLALERMSAKFNVVNPDRALELLEKSYSKKLSKIESISNDKNLEDNERSESIMRLVFADRLIV